MRGIFQGYALSALLFVIAIMPLSHILRKVPGGDKFSKSQENIIHLIYMSDMKLFANPPPQKNGNLITDSENILAE